MTDRTVRVQSGWLADLEEAARDLLDDGADRLCAWCGTQWAEATTEHADDCPLGALVTLALDGAARNEGAP